MASGKKAEGKTKIVFVSSDRDQASFDEYFGSMGDFLALPFADRDTKGTLSSKFGVRGIPTLIVLKPDGELLDANGRGSYGDYL